MIKKILVFLVVINMLLWQAFVPNIVAADDITPTPTDTQSTVTPTPDTQSDTPTPTDNPTDSPTPTVDPNVTPTDVPTPTIDPNVTPTDTPTPTTDVNLGNSGTTDNSINSTGDSGDNSIDGSASDSAEASPSATQTDSPTDTPADSTPEGNPSSNASINTGVAAAGTSQDNSVNVNGINSQVVTQTINIFATQNGSIDLSAPENIASDILLKDKNNSPIINVEALSDNNYAYIDTTINNTANSGDNSASTSGQFVMTTGNAESLVNLVNKVNFTIVDSVIHIIIINIFGTLNGNIVLPTAPNASTCADCGMSAAVNNDATVNNNINSQAISGDNSVTLDGSGSATITTGNAGSLVNVDNIINTNILGILFNHLFVNDFGMWNGSFMGWDGFAATSAGSLQFLSNSSPTDGSNTSGFGTVNINNNAVVNNAINSVANTGGNAIDGQGGQITTGNAYSIVNVLNFVNANFIRSFGLFGFINIFGTWNGDLGDTNSLNPTPTPTPTQTPSITTSTDTSNGQCSEALKSMTAALSTNVNNYVYPGDSVLFFTKIRNNGDEDLHNIRVTLTLSEDGTLIGGAKLTLQDGIPVNIGKEVTVNLGLSNLVPTGTYNAHVQVDGDGCDGGSASVTADTTFLVLGGIIQSVVPQAQAADKTVLGTKTQIDSIVCKNCMWWQVLILEAILFAGYFTFAKRRKLLKGKRVLLITIPVAAYVLFLLLNKSCFTLDSFGLINATSIFCKYFLVWDGLLFALYLLLVSKTVQKQTKKLWKKVVKAF